MAMGASSVKEAEVTIRDIGFGDSIYVKVKRESNVEVTYLIDTGYLIDSAVYSKKLLEDGIKNINTLILTHKHSDHISATSFIVDRYESFELKNIFLSFKDSFFASKKNAGVSNKLKNIYEKGQNINIFDINDLDAVENILDFYVLYPGEDDEPHASNINRNSISLLLCVGSYGVLFMGDATVKEEPIILKQLEKYNIQEVHILKVGHHGSSTSTGGELLNKLSHLQYAIVSSSSENKYKLPSKEFEERWKTSQNNQSCDLFYTEDNSTGIKQNIVFKISKDTGCELLCDCQKKCF